MEPSPKNILVDILWNFYFCLPGSSRNRIISHFKNNFTIPFMVKTKISQSIFIPYNIYKWTKWTPNPQMDSRMDFQVNLTWTSCPVHASSVHNYGRPAKGLVPKPNLLKIIKFLALLNFHCGMALLFFFFFIFKYKINEGEVEFAFNYMDAALKLKPYSPSLHFQKGQFHHLLNSNEL